MSTCLHFAALSIPTVTFVRFRGSAWLSSILTAAVMRMLKSS